MKPVGPRRSAHRPHAVRGRAAAAGQPRRRSLQPRRLSDAAQMGRAGARAATDPGYRVIPTLQLGVEYNPVAGEVAPLATWFLLTEGERGPALFLGTSSDRIGSPEGTQCYFLTTAKYLPPIRTAPYMSVNYSEWDGGWNVPFGASVELGRGFSLQPMYDGARTHLLGSYCDPTIQRHAHLGLAGDRRSGRLRGILEEEP